MKANPELRMSMYTKHVKHCKLWKLNPLTWHDWKFRVWPSYCRIVEWTENDKIDILIEAASLANKLKS